MSGYRTLELHQNGALSTLALNRPEKHNAFNETLIAELTQATQELESNDTVRVVVIKANGRHFSAGADLNWMRKMADFTPEENKKDAQILAHMLSSLAALSKPTIAMVQGKVFGGGLGIIACCDFAICESHSQFCFSEAKLGLTPSTISPFVMRAMGYANTLRYFLSAHTFDAQKAKEMNLVSDVVEPEKLETAVNALAETLLKNGPYAMQEIKRLVQVQRPVDPNIMDQLCESLANVRAGDEAKEGINAFFEKRKPRW